MELYQLKTFIAVAREAHLTRAAAALHISQPSVSTHIKALEEELGLALFIRTRKGMTLTGEGRTLLAEAEQAVRAAKSVFLTAGRLKNRMSGQIRVGINLGADFLKLPGLTGILRENAPGLGLSCFRRHSGQARKQVLDGILDMAFVFEDPQTPSLDRVFLARVEVVAVAPSQWKADVAGKGLEDLARLPWIWTHAACPFNGIIREMFRPLGCLPDQTMVVDHDNAVREMVVSGAGIGLMVRPQAEDAARCRQLVILDQPVAGIDLYLICLKNRRTDPLISCVRQEALGLWHPADPAAVP